MILIPAIDLKGGKCVRLHQGEAEKEIIYSDFPVEIAKKWVKMGATRLHVIDLDGAFTGESQNLEIAAQIKKETGVVIQFGGGLRSMAKVKKVMELGIDRAILGTLLFTDPEAAKEIFKQYGDRIMVGLDVRGRNVSIHGWTGDSGVTIQDALEKIRILGGKEIIFTDISRDGTLTGLNIDAIRLVMELSPLTVFASGGVSDIKDIDQLISISSPGCIIGKALYENRLDLKAALQKVKAHVG